MPTVSKVTAKGYFVTGATPTESNFVNLIDSTKWFDEVIANAVTSVFGRTGVVVAVANDYTFAQIGAKPTTLAGYGITNAELSLGNPTTSGYVLSSTTAGVRSWIAPPAGGGGTGYFTRSGTTLYPATSGDKIGLGTTTTAEAFIHSSIADNTWEHIIQPTNYGTNYPYTNNGVTTTRADRFYSGGYTLNATANISYDNRPDVVGIFWGYNVTANGSRANVNDGSFSFNTETHYFISGQPYFEFHLPAVLLYDGTDRRVNSMYVDKSNGATFQQKTINSNSYYSSGQGTTHNFYNLSRVINGGVNEGYGKLELIGTAGTPYGGRLYFYQGGSFGSIHGVGSDVYICNADQQKGWTSTDGWHATRFLATLGGTSAQAMTMSAVAAQSSGWLNAGNGNGWGMIFTTGSGLTYDSTKVRLQLADNGILLPTIGNHADNAAAVAAGLAVGTVYRNGGVLQIVT